MPCPPPGDLPEPGIEPKSPESPALTGVFSTHPPNKINILEKKMLPPSRVGGGGSFSPPPACLSAALPASLGLTSLQHPLPVRWLPLPALPSVMHLLSRQLISASEIILGGRMPHSLKQKPQTTQRVSQCFRKPRALSKLLWTVVGEGSSRCPFYQRTHLQGVYSWGPRIPPGAASPSLVQPTSLQHHDSWTGGCCSVATNCRR